MTNPFSASSEEVQEGFPRVKVPGVYKCILKETSGEGWESKAGNQIENPVVFTFLIKDEEGNKYEHQAVEFAPYESDTEEKIKNKVLRLTHIASKVLNKEFKIDASSWKEVHDQVVEALTPNVGKDKSPLLWIKLLGSVYNNKAQLGYPGYTGFINRDDEDKKPVMSNKEIQENNKYLSKISESQADKEEEGIPEAGDGKEDEGVPESNEGDDIPF